MTTTSHLERCHQNRSTEATKHVPGLVGRRTSVDWSWVQGGGEESQA